MDRRYIVGCVSALALAFSQAAAAREAEQAQVRDRAAPRGTGSASSAAQTAELDSQEIIVTAQRRDERLQDVPISLTVVSGAQLDRSSDRSVTEALNQVPGVAATVGNQGGGVQIAVRGVTAGFPTGSGSAPIAYYLDSAPFGFVRSAISPDSAPFDLQRVEVLRGPQGTLYGASALNGVVRVLTHPADPSRFELKARAGISTTEGGAESYGVDAAINIPLIEDRLAFRAVAGYQDLGGWIDRPLAGRRDANDSRITTARFKLNAMPTDELSAELSAWISRSDFGAPPISADGRTNQSILPEPLTVDYDMYSGNVAYDFGFATLRSVTSYLKFEQTTLADQSFIFRAPIQLFSDFKSHVFSEELSLSSRSSSTWRWSAGAFYRNAKDNTYQNRPNRIAPIDFTDRSESFALFGEITHSLLDDHLDITAGGRYFHDQVSLNENIKQDGSTKPLIVQLSTFESFSPRVAINWRPTRDQTFYASFSKGFRSGFDQSPPVLAAAPQFLPVHADSLHNYEIGAKGRLFGGRVSYDAAVYFIDWKHVQQLLATPYQGTFVSAVVNGDSASGFGAEVAVSAEPVDGLKLGLTFAWNGLEAGTDVRSGGVLLFAKGDRLNYSPEYTASAAASYAFNVGSGYRATVGGSVNYTSSQDARTILGALVVGRGDPITIGRAYLQIDAPTVWSIRVFVDNIGNENGVSIVPPFGRADWAARIRPRTFGTQIQMKF